MKRIALLMAATVAVWTATATAGLIHHYTFDDADIVGTKGAGDVEGSADATPTGALGGDNITTGQPGVFGQAYLFTNDITASTDPADAENLLRAPSGTVPSGSAARTIALWFSQTVDGPTTQDKLFGSGSTNTDGNSSTGEALDISLEDGGIKLRNSNGNMLYGSGFDFDGADAGWHHLAVRVSGATQTYLDVDIFLDGTQLPVQLVDDGNGGLTTDPDLFDSLDVVDSPFGIGVIGYDAFLYQGFTGLMDDLQIYDNALTDSEISDLATVPEPSAALFMLGGLCSVAARKAVRRN